MKEPRTAIAKQRRDRGITQNKMCELAYISKSAYIKYEYGLTEPAVSTAIRIADLLGIETFEEFRALFGAATLNNVIK